MFIQKFHLSLVAACAALAIAGEAAATTVNFSFDQVVKDNSSGIIGASPWLTLAVSDTSTPGTVQVTVSTLLSTTGSPPQTLTGIWLNIPSVASGLGSLTVTPGSGTGQNPNGSAWTAVRDNVSGLKPGITTGAQSGFFNINLMFPNSGSSSSFQDHQTQTFLLSGTGLTASAFYALSQPTAGGQPLAPYYAVATLTNADGLGAGGIAVVGALSAAIVPLPTALPLLLSGIGMLGAIVRRRRAS